MLESCCSPSAQQAAGVLTLLSAIHKTHVALLSASIGEWPEASEPDVGRLYSLGAGLQILNPAETFGDIIVDYSYVECSSACITALVAFAAKYVGEHCPRLSVMCHRNLSS